MAMAGESKSSKHKHRVRLKNISSTSSDSFTNLKSSQTIHQGAGTLGRRLRDTGMAFGAAAKDAGVALGSGTLGMRLRDTGMAFGAAAKDTGVALGSAVYEFAKETGLNMGIVRNALLDQSPSWKSISKIPINDMPQCDVCSCCSDNRGKSSLYDIPRHHLSQRNHTPVHQPYEPIHTSVHQSYEPSHTPVHQPYEPSQTQVHQSYEPSHTPVEHLYMFPKEPPDTVPYEHHNNAPSAMSPYGYYGMFYPSSALPPMSYPAYPEGPEVPPSKLRKRRRPHREERRRNRRHRSRSEEYNPPPKRHRQKRDISFGKNVPKQRVENGSDTGDTSFRKVNRKGRTAPHSCQVRPKESSTYTSIPTPQAAKQQVDTVSSHECKTTVIRSIVVQVIRSSKRKKDSTVTLDTSPTDVLIQTSEPQESKVSVSEKQSSPPAKVPAFDTCPTADVLTQTSKSQESNVSVSGEQISTPAEVFASQNPTCIETKPTSVACDPLATCTGDVSPVKAIEHQSKEPSSNVCQCTCVNLTACGLAECGNENTGTKQAEIVCCETGTCTSTKQTESVCCESGTCTSTTQRESVCCETGTCTSTTQRESVCCETGTCTSTKQTESVCCESGTCTSTTQREEFGCESGTRRSICTTSVKHRECVRCEATGSLNSTKTCAQTTHPFVCYENIPGSHATNDGNRPIANTSAICCCGSVTTNTRCEQTCKHVINKENPVGKIQPICHVSNNGVRIHHSFSSCNSSVTESCSCKRCCEHLQDQTVIRSKNKPRVTQLTACVSSSKVVQAGKCKRMRHLSPGEIDHPFHQFRHIQRYEMNALRQSSKELCSCCSESSCSSLSSVSSSDCESPVSESCCHKCSECDSCWDEQHHFHECQEFYSRENFVETHPTNPMHHRGGSGQTLLPRKEKERKNGTYEMSARVSDTGASECSDCCLGDKSLNRASDTSRSSSYQESSRSVSSDQSSSKINNCPRLADYDYPLPRPPCSHFTVDKEMVEEYELSRIREGMKYNEPNWKRDGLCTGRGSWKQSCQNKVPSHGKPQPSTGDNFENTEEVQKDHTLPGPSNPVSKQPVSLSSSSSLTIPLMDLINFGAPKGKQNSVGLNDRSLYMSNPCCFPICRVCPVQSPQCRLCCVKEEVNCKSKTSHANAFINSSGCCTKSHNFKKSMCRCNTPHADCSSIKTVSNKTREYLCPCQPQNTTNESRRRPRSNVLRPRVTKQSNFPQHKCSPHCENGYLRSRRYIKKTARMKHADVQTKISQPYQHSRPASPVCVSSRFDVSRFPPIIDPSIAYRTSERSTYCNCPDTKSQLPTYNKTPRSLTSRSSATSTEETLSQRDIPVIVPSFSDASLDNSAQRTPSLTACVDTVSKLITALSAQSSETGVDFAHRGQFRQWIKSLVNVKQRVKKFETALDDKARKVLRGRVWRERDRLLELESERARNMCEQTLCERTKEMCIEALQVQPCGVLYDT